MMKPLLINCDMGEGIGSDEPIMPWIQCCNLACGGHAGDRATMEITAEMAQEHQVHLGAHPSYPDRANFGRRAMVMTKEAFQNSIQMQLELFGSVIQKVEVPWHHVKAHGALYHEGYENERVSRWLLEVLAGFEFRYLFCPSNSLIFQWCTEYGIQPLAEGFVDRKYDASGRLVARSEDGAVLSGREEILQQLEDFWLKDEVVTSSGNRITLKADTFCLHGDHPGCAGAAEAIYQWYERLSD